MPQSYMAGIKIFSDKNIKKIDLEKLNEKMMDVLSEWSSTISEQGTSTEIEWSWYQHINLI